MNTGLARNWWAIGLRGAVAILFAIIVLCLPASTIASLVLMFAAYIAADGAFAILAGMRAAGRGDRWRMLILEGSIVIESDTMPPTRYGPGDTIFFRDGAHARWHVEDRVRKLAFCRQTPPVWIGFGLRLFSKIKRAIMPARSHKRHE